MQDIFSKITGFEWDKNNIGKNQQKHDVYYTECEEMFFSQPFLLYPDPKHSKQEKRYYVLGKTNLNRKLFAVFAIRNNKIRIISARDMSRKERKIYEEAKKDS